MSKMSTAAGTSTTTLARSPRRLPSATAQAFGQAGCGAVRIDHLAGPRGPPAPSEASEPAQGDGRYLRVHGDGDVCASSERSTDFDRARQLAMVSLEHLGGGAVGVALCACL